MAQHTGQSQHGQKQADASPTSTRTKCTRASAASAAREPSSGGGLQRQASLFMKAYLDRSTQLAAGQVRTPFTTAARHQASRTIGLRVSQLRVSSEVFILRNKNMLQCMLNESEC